MNYRIDSLGVTGTKGQDTAVVRYLRERYQRVTVLHYSVQLCTLRSDGEVLV